MGLNYVPRPPRQDLDPPNQFITSSLGQAGYPDFFQFGEHETMEFEKEILDKAEQTVKEIKFH